MCIVQNGKSFPHSWFFDSHVLFYTMAKPTAYNKSFHSNKRELTLHYIILVCLLYSYVHKMLCQKMLWFFIYFLRIYEITKNFVQKVMQSKLLVFGTGPCSCPICICCTLLFISQMPFAHCFVSCLGICF